MKNTLLLLGLLVFASCSNAKQDPPSSENLKEFDTFIQDLEREFIYLEEKREIVNCIKESYRAQVDTISHPYYKTLFYENLLNEFYDSHIILNTNTGESYRLISPIYVQEKNDKFIIKNVASSRLDLDFEENIIGAEVQSFNGVTLQNKINDFPTSCHDKSATEIKEWLANKVLSGKRNEPRILKLQLTDGTSMSLNMDSLMYRQTNTLLTSTIQDNVGIIRINNSLGNSDLVSAFDQALDGMMGTDALILDLRDTPDGGNTGVAEPMMGRFITDQMGYQKCESKEETYTRVVDSRNTTYTKPLYVLVGRWTGSMGEGMAIGFDGMERGTIVGTEMNRLAGGMKPIKLINSNFSFRISFEKMYHLNGTLRETFVPESYVDQQGLLEDEFLAHAMKLIKGQ